MAAKNESDAGSRRWSAASTACSECSESEWSPRPSISVAVEPETPSVSMRCREWARRVVANRWFDRVILLFILINCVFLCMDDIYLVYGSELWQAIQPPPPSPFPPPRPTPRPP